MGVFIWHEWARFVAIFASVCEYLGGLFDRHARLGVHRARELVSLTTSPSTDAIWAGFWGLFFRKFFWDFVGGVRMNTATQKGIMCVYSQFVIALSLCAL